MPSQLYDAYQRDCRECTSLRNVLYIAVEELMRVRKYELFALPLSYDSHHDYWRLVTEPMDLSTIRSRITAEEYPTAALFVNDITLILTVGVSEYRVGKGGAQEFLGWPHIYDKEAKWKGHGVYCINMLSPHSRSTTLGETVTLSHTQVKQAGETRLTSGKLYVPVSSCEEWSYRFLMGHIPCT